MLISFVIPVYRNKGALTLTYQKIVTLFSHALLGYDYEFIFVNDGSDDGSLEELLELREHDKKVQIINFARNFGQVAAVVAGFKETQGDCVVNMSADLQDPPELIVQMVAAWREGNKIVICHRQNREDDWFAKLASAFFYTLIKKFNPRMPKGGFDFLLLDKLAVETFNRIDERNRFFQGDILWLGFSTQLIPYQRLKRTIGKSQWTLSKKLKYFIDGLLNTSYVLIRLMSLVGIGVALSGFLYALVIVYAYFVHQTPFQGWSPIMIVILIVGGVIMLMLGIIGEYIWRIYDEVRKRPYYVIKDRFTNN